MRASRLVSLLLQLQLRGQQTAAELADRLDVSARTVQRDIEALTEAGVPIETVRGPAGGYRLPGGYRTRLTGLTADEAEALFVAPGPAAELGLGGVLTSARLKVLSALPAELQERATRADRLFHLDARGWFREEDRVPHLPALAAAVWHARRVDARYREGRRVVRRRLDPLGFVLKGGAWYLVARRRGEYRVYRVSRFVSVRELEDPAQRPDDFELRRFWDEWSARFERERPRLDVRLRVRAESVRFLRPVVHADGRAIVDAARGSPGDWLELTVPFENRGFAFRELLKFGPDVEVLEPAELRALFADAASATAALYVSAAARAARAPVEAASSRGTRPSAATSRRPPRRAPAGSDA